MARFKSKRSIVKAKRQKGRLAAVPKVLFAARKMHIKIYPSAQQYVGKVVTRSKQLGTINQEDTGLLVAAMTAAAIEEASAGGRTVITVDDFKAGWQKHLSAGSGNCPPWRCARRSVVQRKGVVEKSLPLTRVLAED